MASYRYSTLLEEIRYILVIDAKRTCLPNYPQDFSRYAYGNAAIAMLDKFLVTGHTTEVRSGLLYHGIITGGGIISGKFRYSLNSPPFNALAKHANYAMHLFAMPLIALACNIISIRHLVSNHCNNAGRINRYTIT